DVALLLQPRDMVVDRERPGTERAHVLLHLDERRPPGGALELPRVGPLEVLARVRRDLLLAVVHRIGVLHGLVAILAYDVAEAVAEARLPAEVPVGPDLVLERDVPCAGNVEVHVA